MIRIYLASAVRHLLKKRTFTFINALGLTLGMVSFLLLRLYLNHESSYDQFHVHKDRIYRLNSHWIQQGRSQGERAEAPPPFAWSIADAIPEVESYTRLHQTVPKRQVASRTDLESPAVFEETNVYYGDSTFFEFFSFPLLAGSEKEVLKRPYTAVISASTARKYFGNQNPVGRVLNLTGERSINYEITGIFEDLPSNTHISQIDIIPSVYTKLTEHPEWDIENHWFWQAFYVYFKFRPGTDIDHVNEKLMQFELEKQQLIYGPRNEEMKAWFQPLTDISLGHQYSDEYKTAGKANMLKVLTIVSFFILFIAWINYINLSTSRSLERAREVGVRKVLGSKKSELILQFMVESLTLAVLAIVLSIGLALVLIPIFNDFVVLELSLTDLSSYQIGSMMAMFLAGSLLANVYPALVLSGFRPVLVLKGQFRFSGKGNLLRKSLVVFQYVITILLIAGTLLIYQQTSFLRDRDMGIDLEQLLVVKGPKIKSSHHYADYQNFKQKLLDQPEVLGVTNANFIPGRAIVGYSSFRPAGANQSFITKIHRIDYDFTSTTGLALVAGTDFDENRPANNGGVLINESAMRLFGYETAEEALGKGLGWGGTGADTHTSPIIGVVRDHQQQSHSPETTPAVFPLIRGYESPWADEYFMVRLNPTVMGQIPDYLSKAWNEFFFRDPMVTFFMNEHFDRLFNSEKQLRGVITLFALLAIVIANLGLLGLTAYTVAQKKKELGIRKILGATPTQLLRLLSENAFTALIISALLASPLVYYLANAWLNSYALRISIPIWVYVLPLVMIAIVSALFMAGQTIKASRVNPVNSLREE
ncbi:MAG: FtsX-like permease family protein [Roseivirga sp.]|nr:FtsX-like permease family protein [Roseivirga sp.]